METMHRVRVRIVQTLGIFIICLFILMTTIGAYQIVAHYFFDKPSTVSEELLAYSFTRVALLAPAYVFGRRNRMRTGFLADKISDSVKEYLEVTIGLLTSAFADTVTVYDGVSITKLTMIQIIASLRVPAGYIYVVVPVTGITIVMFSLMNAADILHTDFNKKEDTGV